jgi:hypothetical protein
MFKEWIQPVLIVIIALVAYNLLIKKVLPDSFDSTPM